jgi:membrane protein YqaA with SNARE-associated domain
MPPMSSDVRPPDVQADEPVSEEDRRAAEVAVGPVARWAIHRHLYDWVLSFAHHRHAGTALFVISFIESSVFPIPPDALLMPMCFRRRDRAFRYATLCAAGSVLGGLAGYAIGMFLWAMVGSFFLTYIFSQQTFDTITHWYQSYDFWIVFAAGFTPLPYKVFTIAAGVFGISLPMFLLASAVSRSARFYLEAFLAWKFGEPVERFIDRYFNAVCIAFVVLVIAGFVAIKYMRQG